MWWSDIVCLLPWAYEKKVIHQLPPLSLVLQVLFEDQHCMHSLWLHTSLSHEYTWIAVAWDTPISSAAVDTGYCRAHQCIRSIHFCREIFDFSKKLPFLTLTHLWQSGHRHLHPSLTSFLSLSSISVPHTHFLSPAITLFLIKKGMMVSGPPKATGPSTSKVIFPAIFPPEFVIFCTHTCGCKNQNISRNYFCAQINFCGGSVYLSWS